MTTKVPEFLGDLDGGILEQKLGSVLSDVARGVVNHGKAGKVTLELSMSRIGESSQVQLKHKLSFAKPTRRGKASEEDTTETPMHVAKDGALTLYPDTQAAFEFSQGDKAQQQGERA